VLAATALLAPTASARLPIEEQPTTVEYRAAPAPDQFGARPAAPAGMQRIEPSAPSVTRSIEADGFDWSAAAIGAGAASAVLLLTGAGASAVGHRRQSVRHVGL
jgi:hypothetical protein